MLSLPEDKAPDEDAPPVYNALPWHARVGDGKLHGIKCGRCRQNYLYHPAEQGAFVGAEACCKHDKCVCRLGPHDEHPEAFYCPRCNFNVGDPKRTYPFICDTCWNAGERLGEEE